MSKKHQNTIKLIRTPVITVLGHVDHGKTSLLDAIRHTHIQKHEAGGITQNVRAHQIEFRGQKMTFIDTPGHEAFANMRSRGAKVTDIVLLVVAADDGVKPQTKESIEFSKKANVPIVVAINKIDLPQANTKKVKQELSQNDVLVEEYGGDVLVVETSAKKKINLDKLLETLLLQAEMLELTQHELLHGKGEAVVLESRLDNYKGPVALILLKAGSLTIGDYLIYEKSYSKVRAMLDDEQQNIKTAYEGDPVLIVGVNKVLNTGEILFIEKNQDSAKKLIKPFEKQTIYKKKNNIENKGRLEENTDVDLLSEFFKKETEIKNLKTLNIVLKTDSQGTLEAVRQKLEELNNAEVQIKILDAGTGNINEKDILRAKNGKGIVIGFQVEISNNVMNIANRERVLVKNYSIIYTLLEEVKAVLDSMLKPEEEIVEISRARVKKVFELTNGKKVAGIKVIKGIVIKGYKCFIMRGEDEIGNGKIVSLKQNKDEVKEVKKEQECGILIEPEIEFCINDEIICYKIEKHQI